MKWNFSRRNLLKGAAGLAGAGALTKVSGSNLLGTAFGQTATPKSAVLVIFLRGGYNALFSSADVFAANNTFGVTGTNTTAVGSGLVVDKSTLGTDIVPLIGTHMAAFGLNHGLSSHTPARTADFTNGTRAYPLMLAAAMGGSAAIKCAVVGSGSSAFPDGPAPAEGNVSYQLVSDMNAALNLIGAITDPTLPGRNQAAAALTASKNQSTADLANNPVNLANVTNAYSAAIAALQTPTQAFNFPAAQTAYGVTGTSVNSFSAQMLAAELMVRAGSNVVCAVSNAGWDTHGDTSGGVVRGKMGSLILPGLKAFTQRVVNDPNFNVTVAIYGDFARSLPGSDHAKLVSATAWGPKVKQGVSGKINSPPSGALAMPAMNAAGVAYSIPGFWSFLASAAKSPSNPFGANPHATMVLP